MDSRKIVKLVNDGRYAAEVEVTLIQTGHEWEPYNSVDDALKLDRVRAALKAGDLKAAAREAEV